MGRDRTFSHHTATIANGASVSGGIPVGVESIAVIVCPPAWTAAVLAFELSLDGGLTWIPVVDDAAGAEVSIAAASIAAAVGRAIVNASIIAKLAGLSPLVRLASGPAGARVVQGGARTFEIVTKTP